MGARPTPSVANAIRIHDGSLSFRYTEDVLDDDPFSRAIRVVQVQRHDAVDD